MRSSFQIMQQPPPQNLQPAGRVRGQVCRCLALVLGLGTASLGAATERTAPASIDPAEQPNFVIVVADDLGMECIGGYGGRSYQTPHLDRLLAAGMQFSHCFSNPYCSPSRGQLLTGRYPLHNGIKRVIFDPKQHREFLDPAHERSFANQLRDVGYATAMAGKWQLSFLEERDTILDFGFDEYQAWQIWVKGTKTSRYAQPTMRQNGVVLGPNQLAPYGPDANLAFLTDFIQRKKHQPFCVYYTSLLPHWPWEPTPDSGVPLLPADGMGNWKRFMPDMVAYLDKQVGQLVATLETEGLLNNTVFIFTADNGTDRKVTSRWTDGKHVRNVPGGKGTMTDAGTRVPLIVCWPGRISAGVVIDDLIDLSDLFPTVLDLAGQKRRPGINGKSFAARLLGKPSIPRTWIHVQDQHRRHVRDHQFILSDTGAMRPVVETGRKSAQPLESLTPTQQTARIALAKALQDAISQTQITP